MVSISEKKTKDACLKTQFASSCAQVRLGEMYPTTGRRVELGLRVMIGRGDALLVGHLIGLLGSPHRRPQCMDDGLFAGKLTRRPLGGLILRVKHFCPRVDINTFCV